MSTNIQGRHTLSRSSAEVCGNHVLARTDATWSVAKGARIEFAIDFAGRRVSPHVPSDTDFNESQAQWDLLRNARTFEGEVDENGLKKLPWRLEKRAIGPE